MKIRIPFHFVSSRYPNKIFKMESQTNLNYCSFSAFDFQYFFIEYINFYFGQNPQHFIMINISTPIHYCTKNIWNQNLSHHYKLELQIHY
jgi:hypothetical protein